MGDSVCVIVDCGGPVSCRGLCVAHYQIARKFVLAGRTTWETLEKANMAKPRTRINRKSLFTLPA